MASSRPALAPRSACLASSRQTAEGEEAMVTFAKQAALFYTDATPGPPPID